MQIKYARHATLTDIRAITANLASTLQSPNLDW